jgi:two-component system, OmpR family, sensor histidine kinase KdpD
MPDWLRAVIGVGGVALVTLLFTRVINVNNGATVALVFLLVVLLVAATSRFWAAAVTSIAAVFCFNFFFIPPVGTLNVADPENWVALAAFLAVSLVGSNLSSAIRERERAAVDRLHLLEERKHAEIARQREALSSALLASIGHDLRTPLTALKVAAINLQSNALSADDRDEQADVVITEVERLTRLFENILDMARIDAQAVAATRRWVHPSEIWEAALDQVSHSFSRHAIDLKLDEAVMVFLDPRLTAAALTRVLENAAKYAPLDTTISIAMRAAPAEFTITVSDQGPGIAPADLPRIFDRFFRGELTGRRVGGTGMGLPIARGLLLAENGRITAENRSEGGTRVTMIVPAEMRALDATEAAS